MKGVIINCIQEMVNDKFGRNKWPEILERAGLRRNTIFLATENVEEDTVLKLISSACETLKVSKEKLFNEFGDYWMNSFAPKYYSIYFSEINSAKEFIMNLSDIHTRVVINIPNAKPPSFEYEWQSDNTLLITYNSNRGLIDLVPGLIKGIGHYYKEKLSVEKIDDKHVKVVFLK